MARRRRIRTLVASGKARRWPGGWALQSKQRRRCVCSAWTTRRMFLLSEARCPAPRGALCASSTQKCASSPCRLRSRPLCPRRTLPSLPTPSLALSIRSHITARSRTGRDVDETGRDRTQ
eukprot:Amastigsp_a342632_177.p6 type:complete len:120 gc:universal Amastigsp_a342632_177:380-21(-)